MAEIVNLRLARKNKERRDRQAKAAANRARFGQTAADRAISSSEQNRLEKAVEGARRDKGDD